MITHKQFALNLAAQAGKLMLDNFRMGMSKVTKNDLTPVTEVDLAINSLLVSEVQANFPGYGIFAEEESIATDHEYVWVCDPIDGTIAYSHGIAIASFSLALVQNGEPVLGLVLNPFQNNLYFAEKGKGAYLNDKPIKVTDRTDLSTSLVFVEHWREAPL
jgi:myo-inositol-1(or 4)-monophosphatase